MIIDTHSHIIPSVDDGSFSMNCTLSLIISAKMQGVTAMMATPHSEAFFRDPDAVYEAFDKMKTVLQGWFPQMQFFLGSEIRCERKDIQKILEYLTDRRLPTMNKTRYVLIEFDPAISPEEAAFCVSELQNAGFIPIVAHPERYAYLDIEFIRSIRENGCLVQINVYSLEEYGEKHLCDRARRLIQEKLVDFLGSDCHNSFIRGVSIDNGMEWLLKGNAAQQYLDDITHLNAFKFLISNNALR